MAVFEGVPGVVVGEEHFTFRGLAGSKELVISTTLSLKMSVMARPTS